MKVKISKTKAELIEIELDYPLYAMVEEGDFDRLYVKITKDWFVQIKSSPGSYELFRMKRSNDVIPGIWFDNSCAKKYWKEAHDDFLERLKSV